MLIVDVYVTLFALQRRGMPWKECHVMDEERMVPLRH
jgi:hypothetical protein